MSQHDLDVSNGSGAAVRADLNLALVALATKNSGSSQPATMYAYQWWVDTTVGSPATAGLVKMRNAANSAWIEMWTVDRAPGYRRVHNFTASGTWYKPDGLKGVLVYVKAGGASGGSSSSATAQGGGGGEGEYAWGWFEPGELAGSVTVTVGAGGALVAANNNTVGNAGNTSSFGSHITCLGGTGGTSGNAGGGGGSGGSGGSGGHWREAGDRGHVGSDAGASTGVNSVGGGKGGSTYSGGVGSTVANSGGGGAGGSTAVDSIAGAAGRITVIEIF